VLTATLGVGAVAWVVSVQQMQGMDMGVATDLSFQFFVAAWLAMIAAVMPPGRSRRSSAAQAPLGLC
jgi:hypothetical protein